MPERHELEALFVAHLPVLDRLLAAVARRQGLRDDDAAEFAAWAKLRLVEHDYAVLQKFRGESSLATYLAVVATMLAREFRVQRWGRWRPSAEARRRGPLAVRLETLVRRDRHTLQEAAQVLRSGGETALSDRQLAVLLASLPERAPSPRDAEPLPPEAVRDERPADALVLEREADAERRGSEAALGRALATLPHEDQAIVRLRFWEGLTVADVARALGLEQRPLYRRLERALGHLRAELERAGVSRERARALLAEPSAEPSAEPGEIAPPGPSTSTPRRWRLVP